MNRFTYLALILVVLSAVPILAREDNAMFELENFSADVPIQAIILGVGDAVSFNMLGHTHVLYPSQIHGQFAKLKVFVNNDVAGSKGLSLPLQLGNSILLDVDKDKKDDLRIRLYEVDNETVTLIFESLGDAPKLVTAGNENVSSAVTGNAVADPSADYTPYIVIGAIILSLLALLYLRTKKDSAPAVAQDKPSESVDVNVEDIPFEDKKEEPKAP